MRTLSQITVGVASFALVVALSMPIAGAAGGDGTGPPSGADRQQQGKWYGPCNGPGQGGYGHGHGYGPGHGHGHFRNCDGSGAWRGGPHMWHGPGHGGFVDKDGDGVCDYHPDNGKGAEPSK